MEWLFYMNPMGLWQTLEADLDDEPEEDEEFIDLDESEYEIIE